MAKKAKQTVRSHLGSHHRPPIFRNPFAQLRLDAPQKPPWQTPPAWWTGSQAEWAVYWALLSLRVPFQYQGNLLGGRQVLGGAVGDFIVPDLRLVIRVQGLHWHYGLGREQQENDVLQRSELASRGYTVVDIDEDNALADPKYFVEEALQGRDHSRAARGII